MLSFKQQKQQLRRLIGPTLQALGYRSGLMQLAAKVNRSHGALALMYHSVADEDHTRWVDPSNHVPAEIFAQQMASLARKRRVVSLADLVALLQRGESPATGTVVITFDDGYLDNLTVAAPILEHYGLPATIFLATGHVERGEPQWIDQVYSIFKFRSRNRLAWGVTDADGFDLAVAEQYQAGYRTVCKSLLSAAPDQRRTWLTKLREQLQPAAKPPRLTMHWDEVRSLVTRYRCFEIGGHTMEHRDLSCASKEEAQKELTGCARQIKENLGVQPQFFSFPYGRTSPKLRELVAEAGFRAAFSSDGFGPVIRDKTNLFALPRVEGPASMRQFDLTTSVANTGIWRRLGR